VICVDEFGPVEVRPVHGHSWQRAGHPSRIRATYNRHHGVRHYISSYDLAANRLVMRCYRRKRWQEFLSFLKTLRRSHPRSLRLFVVLDNFSPHRRAEVVRWTRLNNVRLVFTPTYASWLNRIEPLFAGVRYFALNNSDYRDHEETRRAINAYVAWRNRHPSHPKLRRIEKHKPTSRSGH
jgi:transposase